MHIVKCLFLLLVLVVVEVGLHRVQGGYSLSKLTSSFEGQPTSQQDSEAFASIAPLLDQPFHFLGSGGTSFAFLSEDKQIVLKLFKHQHLRPSTFLWNFSLPWLCDFIRIKNIVCKEHEQHHKRAPFFFTSCAIAYEELKKETGLLFFTSHKNACFSKKVQLIDRLGFALEVDLSQTEFAVQWAAIPLFTYLDALIAQKKMHEARAALDSLTALLATRCSKGIADRDPNLMSNFGFITPETHAVEFDIGSFLRNPQTSDTSYVKKEIFYATYALREWLKTRSPELLEYLYTKTVIFHVPP